MNEAAKHWDKLTLAMEGRFMRLNRFGLAYALSILASVCLAAGDSGTDPAKVREFNVAQKELEHYLQEGQIEQALNKGEETYVLSKEIFGIGHKTAADMAYYYGLLLHKVGNNKKAEEVLKEAITMHETAYGKDARELIQVLTIYGEILPIEFRSKDAAPNQRSMVLHRALNIQKQNAPNDHIAYADLVARIAPALSKNLPDRDEALQLMQDALSVYEEKYGDDAPQLIPILKALGFSHAQPLRTSKQKQFLNRALEITRDSYPENRILYADLAFEAGTNLFRASQSGEAGSYLKESYKIYKTELGAEHDKTSIAAFTLGEFYFSTKDNKNAVEFLSTALLIISKNPSYRNYELRIHALLAEIYDRDNKGDLATEHLLAMGRMTPWQPDQEIFPVIRFNPDYPQAALRAGIDGSVEMDFTIDKSGRVKDVVVINSEGHKSFQGAAVKAMNKWRYFPRFENGMPVDTPHIKTKMTFEVDSY